MFSLIIFIKQANRKKTSSFLLKICSLIRSLKDIEIIFIVNSTNISSLEQIQEFQKNHKKIKVKFLFSTKEKKFDEYLETIISLITNDYVIFLHENTKILQKDFLINIEKMLKKEKTDILEFIPKISGIIDWNPKNLRIDNNLVNKEIKIEENKLIIPFSYPFILNKIISFDILEKTINNYKNVNSKNNSSLLFSKYIYLIFFEAKTYKLLSTKYLEFIFDKEIIIVYNNILDIWNRIQDVCKNKVQFIKEIEYAKLFYLKFIVPSLLHTTFKKKILIHQDNIISKKYENKLNDIISNEYNNFDILNNYMLFSKNKEVNLMKKNYPINKWDKLLKDIE